MADVVTPYQLWAARYPEAAAALFEMIGPQYVPDAQVGKSEAWAQQQQRLQVARAGGMAWRNNVGATPARCPDCGAQQQPVRYGLANDSAALNKRIKSSDLIGCRPVLITPAHVGQTIGQFVSIEVKRPGWHYVGDDRESAQAAWLAVITKLGGYARFSTGEVDL